MCAFPSNIRQRLGTKEKNQCHFKNIHKNKMSLQQSCLTLQDKQLTLAAASIGCQGVAIDGTGAVEAAWAVVTAIGTNMTSSGQGTLVYI